MRPAVMYQHPNLAADCSANETDKAMRTDDFNRSVDTQMGIERARIATKPADWVDHHVADQSADLAVIYYHVVLNFDDPATIGKLVKSMLENKIRDVAEYVIREKSQ